MVDLVLAPFLIVIKHMSPEQAYDIIKEWLIKCDNIEKLNPSFGYFDNRIKAAINNSIHSRIPPILVENIENRYPDWL
jgi:hypothetical protein